VLCSIFVVTAGCGSGPASTSTAPVTTAPATAAPAPPTSPVRQTTAATSDALPGELVGSWSSTTATTEIAYRFLANGRFRSIEILNQARPGGIFEFRVQQDGLAEVTGSRLLLRPTASTTTRRDPDDPENDYTDRPASLEQSAYAWQVAGTTLSLRSDDGNVIALTRQ
jgi:hypothetical protein